MRRTVIFGADTPSFGTDFPCAGPARGVPDYKQVWGIFDRRNTLSALDTKRRGTTIHVLGSVRWPVLK
jgi:hypothetical protein